jgi:two-component system sensor histidine kinase SenX3
MIFVVAVSVVVGAVIGVLIGRRWRSHAVTRQGNNRPGDDPSALGNEELAVLLCGAVDHLEIGIVVASATGQVIYRNATGSVLVGTHAGLLVDDELTSALTDARLGQSSQRLVELHGPPKLWLAITAEPVPNGVAVAMIEDVSERMRTDVLRSDFVSNISHELKTPVGAIAVLAEALADERDPEVVKRLADHLVEESHRAVSTIDDLLRLSQIEVAGSGDDVVDLTKVVEMVVRTAIQRAEISGAGQGVNISAFDTPSPIKIRGDQPQLVSAIGNLVENAVKYSHDGDLVQVRTRIDDTAVEVMVVDQGVGIPERDLHRIFERFYRVDKARSRDTGGTGLGLAIVRHVATNHGGEVLVSSQEGEGSTFVLRLPASRVVSDDEVANTDEELAS